MTLNSQYVEASREAERVSKAALAELIGVISGMYRDGGYMPDSLRKAWEAYSAAIANHQNIAADEANRRRDEHNAMELHYVSSPGSKYTLCGLRTETKGGMPHGWVGRDYEYYTRRVASGGKVCPGCDVRIKEGL